MKKNNKEILLALNFNKNEIDSLVNNKNIEELIVLLSSLHIKDIKNYLLNNSYLFTKNIFSLAKNISNVFNNNRDFNKTLKILTENKYNIIDEKGW